MRSHRGGYRDLHCSVTADVAVHAVVRICLFSVMSLVENLYLL